METTKTHSSRIGLTLLLVFIGLTAFISSANADHLYDPRQKCEEISQYLNPDLPILKDTDPPLTGIQQNCENLDHHLTFPGAHKPDIKLSEHKKAVKTSNQPWSQHMHRYFNDSQEDLNQTITQNGKQIKVNFYYISAIDTFEFHLEDDFMENILLDTVQCAGLPKGNNCSGTGTLGEDGNGDNMGFNVSFDKQNGIIKWNFPGQSNNWAKPKTYGENPTLDKLTGNPDTTNEENRMLELGINFKTKDVQEDVWSATITSKVLIKDFAAKMSPGKTPASSDWEAIETDADQPGEFNNYYWFPIGTTTTIWERAPLPPPPEENVCKDLTAKLDKNQIEILGKKAYKIDTNITFEPENVIPSEVKILWESSDKNGEFFTPSPKGAVPYSKLGTGKVETTLKQTVYYSGTGTLTIQLTGIDKKLANTDKCKILVAIPSEDIRCEKLLVDHPEVVYTETYSAFRSKALDNNANTFNSKISYTVDKGHGEFYLSKPASVPKNPSAEILETVPALTVIFGGPYIDFSGIKLDNGNLNFSGLATNLVLDLATGNLNKNQTDNYLDKNLDFTSSPKYYGGTNSLIALSVDANPGKGSAGTNIDYSSLKNTQIDYKTPVNTGKLNQDDLTLKDPLITKTIDLPETLSNPLLESVTVPQNTYVYFIGKQAGKNTIHVDATDSSEPTCERDFDIERLPPAPICQKLNFITNTKGNLVAGQPAMINIDPTDSKGAKLPKTTKFTLTTTTDGKFKTLAGKDLGNTALLSDFPIQLVGATKAGTVKVEISKDDPLYSGFCAGSAVMEKTSEPLVCTSLKHQIKVLGTGTISNSLEKNMAYEIASEASYSKTYTNTITYTIDPAYGAFVKVANAQALAAYITGIKTLQLTDKLDATTLSTFVGSSLVANTITADQNKTVYLFTYSTAPASKTDTLKIQATGFDNADCNKIVPFTVPGVIPPLVLKCESLAITPLDGTPFDPSKSSTFKLTGDYKNHANGIEVSVSGKGTVSKNVEEIYSPKITFAQTEVNNSTNNLFFQYKKEDTYSLQTDTVSISAKAVNAPAGVCESSVSKQATPSTPGGGSPGGGSPGGGGGIPPKESPTIQKLVFKTNKLKDADDELNISKDTTHITYMIVFTAGEDSKSVEIQDTELENPGTIQSKNTKTVLNGTLDYDGMIINVWDKKADKKYTILKTANYKTDDTNSDISDKNFTDHSHTESSNEKLLKYYEDKYKCEKDTTKLCIDTDSFEDTVKSFKKGDKIKFKNIQTLGETGKIVIKYQMKNNTAIDEKTCLLLKANKDGCGEEFENKAKFISYDNANFANKTHEKSDGTKVIAVCPFILTREGGDVFFHDVLDTGVDVEKCGVKSSTGPGITPEPEKPQEHAPTGTSSETTPVLSQPTHSICKLSNDKNNVEGYNDVLENFSSSICELKAEVAQAWKEKNINKSIAANVERLARWQENLTIDKITNMSDLETITNRKNGVFVKKDGNLEIGSNGTKFTIESTDLGVPAAQTYIIQNGDLVINSNIKYANASLTLGGLVNPRKIPSAAFIVIDGNIIIDDSVTQIDGILMAVDLDGNGTDGKVKQREKTTNFLKINGSLIGDVYELFSNRTGAGDPKKDEGSVTIHYDSRILLNTPPGISELVDVKQAVVPN